METLQYLMKLQFVQQHRRVIALLLLAVVGILQFLTSPDMLAECLGATDFFCTHVAQAQHYLVGIATYAATVGTWFKNDPLPGGAK